MEITNAMDFITQNFIEIVATGGIGGAALYTSLYLLHQISRLLGLREQTRQIDAQTQQQSEKSLADTIRIIGNNAQRQSDNMDKLVLIQNSFAESTKQIAELLKSQSTDIKRIDQTTQGIEKSIDRSVLVAIGNMVKSIDSLNTSLNEIKTSHDKTWRGIRYIAQQLHKKG